MADQQEKTVHQINVFADNFQFYLRDQADDCDYPEDWNDNLLTRLFACGEKVVGIGTVRDLDCDITLEVFSKPMDENQEEPELADYDHVAQCNIEIPSGKLIIGGCTTEYEETTKLDLVPGHYGIRIFWSGLDKTDTLGFEGDDQYKVQIWPETHFDEVIFKFWRHLALQLNTQNN